MVTFGTFEIIILAIIISIIILVGVLFFRSIKKNKDSSI